MSIWPVGLWGRKNEVSNREEPMAPCSYGHFKTYFKRSPGLSKLKTKKFFPWTFFDLESYLPITRMIL